ncbi:MAG: PIN domain-containing protein [Patescibacteria group bacterium]|nr:PIN domain-containing protein [Patescibacteria group bacterium]
MKKYLIDTNIILRYLLKDDEILFKKSSFYFEQAKNKKIVIEIIPEVIFELDYVLRGVYQLKKDEASSVILKIIKTPFIFIKNRELLIECLEKYQKTRIDLFDIYLFYLAKKDKKEVLSFDRDFKKFK